MKRRGFRLGLILCLLWCGAAAAGAAGDRAKPDGTAEKLNREGPLWKYEPAVRDEADNPNVLAALEGGYLVSFSRDGTKILTSDGEQAWVWDTKTFRPLTEPMEHAGMRDAALSADGRKLLTVGHVYKKDKAGSHQWAGGEARLWDTATGKALLPPIKHGDPGVYSAALSPNGKLIATCSSSDGLVRLWDATTGRQSLELQCTGEVTLVEFSPDGRTLLGLCESSAHLWDPRTGRQRTEPVVADGNGGGAAFSRDGGRLAVTNGYNCVTVYDTTSGKKLSNGGSKTLDDVIGHVAMSPDGKKVVTASTLGTQVWDADTGEELMGWDFYAGPIVFSPDGSKVVFVGSEKAVGMRDVVTGKRVQTFGRLSQFGSAAFSPDGKRLALGYSRYTVIVKVEPGH